MNEQTVPASGACSGHTAAPAALLVDSAGLISVVSREAANLLARPPAELRGTAFAGLFEFEVVSSDPEILAAQWEALCASPTPQSSLALKAEGEGEPRAVTVTLSPADDGSGMWFACLDTAHGPSGKEGAPMGASDAWALLSESGAAGLFDLDFAHQHFEYSPSWKRLLGYAPSELADTYGMWLELIHPEDTGAAPDQVAGSQGRGAVPFGVEFRMRHRRGHWVWVQCAGVQVPDDSGAPGRIIGFMTDITERKEVEESGLASEDRLLRLGEDGALALFDADLAAGSVWMTDSFKKLVGYDPDDLPSSPETLLGLLPTEDAEGGLEHWLGGLGGSAAARVVATARFRHRDGRWIDAVVGGLRVYSKKRDLLRFVGFALSAPAGARPANGAVSGNVVTAALDTLAEGVLGTDSQGRIILANASALAQLGRSREDVLGRPAAEVFRLIHAETGKLLPDDPCEMALASEGPLPLTVQHALAPAREGVAPSPLAWTARAVYGQGPRAEGVVIVFRNPDEMNLSPEELVKANRFEALAMLAGGITHDFNNLLTTILGGISLAKDHRDTSGLDDSEKACMAAKGLAKQLLSFAKGGGAARSVVPSGDILADSAKIAAAGATVQVPVRAAENVPPIQVDRSQILQVFQNLIVNAIQAMPPAPHKGVVSLSAEGVTLEEGEMPPLPKGDYVRFEVRDNGSGIKPEHLERIWDPFFTTKKHGTGLGLATVLSIVRKHGGQIGVASQLGVGTAFTLYFPIASAPIEAQARRAPTLRYGTGRILIMDDDPKICAITANMLTNLEYTHDAAKHGEEAVKLYRSYFNIGRPYDAVIMDLTVIGGMGGEDAFKAIREIDPDVRAIAASGYDNEDMARRYLDMGFCAYLTKPYRVGDLARVLKTVLG